MSLNVTQSNNNLTLQVSQSNVKATLSVTQNIKELHITAIQNNEIIKLQPVINVNSSEVIETDPVFVASEAYLFEEGDKEKLDNLFNTTNHSQLTLNDGTNPHGTTKSDIGLGSVDNTSDLDKPISTATQTALNLKLDKDFSTLPSATTPLAGTEEVAIVQGGETKKVAVSNIGGGGETYPKVVLFDADIPQLTGVTGVTKIKDCVVPANTIPETCMLRLTWQVMWNKSTDYKFFYATFNSNNVGLGIIVNYIGTYTNNTNFEIQEVKRNCVVKNGNLYVVKNAHLRSGYTTSLAQINPIDVTQDNTFNIWGYLGNALDNLDVLGFSVEIIK